MGILTVFSYLKSAHDNTPKEDQGNPAKWTWNFLKWRGENTTVIVGGQVDSHGNITAYGGLNLGGLSVPAIAYSTNHGFGFGNAGNPGYNEFIYPSVNYNAPEENAIKGIQAGINNYISSNIVNGPFIDISLTEALFWLVNISKMKQIELFMYHSEYGYFYERTQGFAEYSFSRFYSEIAEIIDGVSVYDFDFPKVIMRRTNTIGRSYSFSLTFSGNNVFVKYGIGQKARVIKAYHSHPSNGYLSFEDRNTKLFKLLPGSFFAVGWDGFLRGVPPTDNGYKIPELQIRK